MRGVVRYHHTKLNLDRLKMQTRKIWKFNMGNTTDKILKIAKN